MKNYHRENFVIIFATGHNKNNKVSGVLTTIKLNFTNFIASGLEEQAAVPAALRMDLYGVCVFSNLLLSFFPGILFAATLLLLPK